MWFRRFQMSSPKVTRKIIFQTTTIDYQRVQLYGSPVQGSTDRLPWPSLSSRFPKNTGLVSGFVFLSSNTNSSWNIEFKCVKNTSNNINKFVFSLGFGYFFALGNLPIFGQITVGEIAFQFLFWGVGYSWKVLWIALGPNDAQIGRKD